MRNLFFLSSFFILIFTTNYAQVPEYTCANRADFANRQMESPNLTQQQIEEAKKYDIHFYALDLEMDNMSTDIVGTGEVYGEAKEDLDSVLIELHSSFDITEVRVDNVSQSFNREESTVKVPVNLLAGQDFRIAIDYNGTPPTQASNPLGGTGMSNEFIYMYGKNVTYSLSEPFSAYEWFPCKQDLRDKADSVSVKVTAPDSCKVGSNGVLENVVDLGNGTSRYEWFHRHPIDYYLISVAIADYDEYNMYAHPSGTADSVLIQNYIYDDPNVLLFFQDEIHETVDFIELFADLFGPYPFEDEKYGHSMAPIGGGMEHQTMTTLGSFGGHLVSHELGHQWFGNSVTCASWSDVWVNEGFAEYSSYLALEYLQPFAAHQRLLDMHDDVMNYPGGSVWILDSMDVSSIFSGRLTYDKGASFVHILRFMMDDDTLFYQGLQNYLTEFKDSVALAPDVKDHLEAVSSVDLDPAFNQWYYGEGYPTYSLKWNSVGDDLIFQVSHTTSSSTPTFTGPLEIYFQRTNRPDTTVRVNISSNNDHFVISDFGSTEDLARIDPKNWLINKVDTVFKDENFSSVSKEEKPAAIKIYPNPSEGVFNISTGNVSKKKIQVLTPRGTVVYKGEFNEIGKINLQDQSSGNYIIKITGLDGKQWVRTIVKR